MSTIANYLDELGTLHQLDAATSVREAVLYMSEHRVGAVAMTIFGEIVGVITERDVLKRAVAVSVDLDATPSYEIMTPVLVTAELTDSVDTAVESMRRSGARHVVVQHPRRRSEFVGFLGREELLLAEHRRRSRSHPPQGEESIHPLPAVAERPVDGGDNRVRVDQHLGHGRHQRVDATRDRRNRHRGLFVAERRAAWMHLHESDRQVFVGGRLEKPL